MKPKYLKLITMIVLQGFLMGEIVFPADIYVAKSHLRKESPADVRYSSGNFFEEYSVLADADIKTIKANLVSFVGRDDRYDDVRRMVDTLIAKGDWTALLRDEIERFGWGGDEWKAMPSMYWSLAEAVVELLVQDLLRRYEDSKTSVEERERISLLVDKIQNKVISAKAAFRIIEIMSRGYYSQSDVETTIIDYLHLERDKDAMGDIYDSLMNILPWDLRIGFEILMNKVSDEWKRVLLRMIERNEWFLCTYIMMSMNIRFRLDILKRDTAKYYKLRTEVVLDKMIDINDIKESDIRGLWISSPIFKKIKDHIESNPGFRIKRVTDLIDIVGVGETLGIFSNFKIVANSLRSHPAAGFNRLSGSISSSL